MRYFMIDEDQVRALERVRTRLHSERRIGGDEMRDLGHELDAIARVVRQLELPDELGLFDNYAVLHYDPEAKSYAETEQEKQARRDPILFGLMRGRRVLYVVGDWIDETCDLTLDQIADKLGAEVVKTL